MDRTNELLDMLSKYLNYSKPAMKSIKKMVLAILKGGTININNLAGLIPDTTKLKSIERNLQRFLKNNVVDRDGYAKLVLDLFNLLGKKVTCIIDGTKWQRGEKVFNIFVLSVYAYGISIPLIWVDLNKDGSTDTIERISLIEEAKRLLGEGNIECILADAEFVGEDWFSYLREQNVPYKISMRKNFIIETEDDSEISCGEYFDSLKINQERMIEGYVCNEKMKIYGKRTEDGELLVIGSTYEDDGIEKYRERYSIEFAFKCLKSNGFDLEKTHVTIPERVDLLMMLACIAYCITTKVGLIATKSHPIEKKEHGRSEFSLFKYGARALRTILNNVFSRAKDLEILLGTIFAPWSLVKYFLQNVKFSFL